MYDANESNGTLNGRAEILANLSNPSSTNITVLVESNDISASKSHTHFTHIRMSLIHLFIYLYSK